MSSFSRYIGVDYSGAKTPNDSLTGLRVYTAKDDSPPVEIPPPLSHRTYWTRRGLAHSLVQWLSEGVPSLIGIDHGFSFPLQYFDKHGISRDWDRFLEDFCDHWPTDQDHLYVDFVRNGSRGNGAARTGNRRWRRLTEIRAGAAKSVFHFDVPGQVAHSTHAGIPWLRFIRREFESQVHFWPFDGWEVPAGRSVIAEVYPTLWSHQFPKPAGATGDQHDAYCIAAWLSRTDRDNSLGTFLMPALAPREAAQARTEGWILGVAG